MSSRPVIGMIVPPAANTVPPEAISLYADRARFLAAGLGLERITPDGYDGVIDRVGDLARDLARQGADAVVLMGTSLSFYRGVAFNNHLLATMRAASGRPVTTMSTAVVDALQVLGVTRLAVATAYGDSVNVRLKEFLVDSGFIVEALEAFQLDTVKQVQAVADADLLALGHRAHRSAPNAEALLISCGGLHTLSVTVPLEAQCGVPVVSSALAGAWASMRLLGLEAREPGRGRLLEIDAPP